MARKKSKGNFLGRWAFIIGFILAIIIALFSAADVPSWAVWVIALLGLIVGLLNVTGEEAIAFLVASIAFLVSFNALSKVRMSIVNWPTFGVFFDLIALFIAPAAAVVAFRALFVMTKD